MRFLEKLKNLDIIKKLKNLDVIEKLKNLPILDKIKDNNTIRYTLIVVLSLLMGYFIAFIVSPCSDPNHKDVENKITTLEETVEKRESDLEVKRIQLEDRNRQIETSKEKIKTLTEKVESAKPWFEMEEEEQKRIEEENARKEAEKKAEEERKAEEARKEQERLAEEARKEEERKAEEERIAKENAEKNKYETGITYSQIARNPDDYLFQLCKFKGKVVQVIEGDTNNNLRVAVNGNYDNILLVEYDPSIVSQRILEDDQVTVYGISMGICSYTSTIGSKISIPSILCDKIDIN